MRSKQKTSSQGILSRNPLRILITEDHASTRLGIKQILKDEFPSVRFGEAPDESGTLALLERQTWDLLILDLTLPGRSGAEILSEIKQRWPGLRVLIYSAHSEDDFAPHLLRQGAAGYLTKERAPEELAAAVRLILTGGQYLSPSLSARLAAGLSADRNGLPHPVLSEREFQVLRLTAAGQTGKAIASELGLSQKTISTYRARLLKKLHFDTTAELIQYALRQGLI